VQRKHAAHRVKGAPLRHHLGAELVRALELGGGAAGGRLGEHLAVAPPRLLHLGRRQVQAAHVADARVLPLVQVAAAAAGDVQVGLGAVREAVDQRALDVVVKELERARHARRPLLQRLRLGGGARAGGAKAGGV